MEVNASRRHRSGTRDRYNNKQWRLGNNESSSLTLRAATSRWIWRTLSAGAKTLSGEESTWRVIRIWLHLPYRTEFFQPNRLIRSSCMRTGTMRVRCEVFARRLGCARRSTVFSGILRNADQSGLLTCSRSTTLLCRLSFTGNYLAGTAVTVGSGRPTIRNSWTEFFGPLRKPLLIC